MRRPKCLSMAKPNEVFVSDGYINRRVIVFDANTGAFRRMWGAFGNIPLDSPDQLKNARIPHPNPGTRGPDPPAAPARGVNARPAATGPGSGPVQHRACH